MAKLVLTTVLCAVLCIHVVNARAIVDRTGSCSDEALQSSAPHFQATPNDYTLTLDVDSSTSLFDVDSHFLSVTFDANSIVNHFDSMPWQDPGLNEMAAALGSMYLRFGGTEADAITYQMSNGSSSNSKNNETFPPEVLLREDFEHFIDFLNGANWKLIFGVNGLNRNPDGSWNSTNSESLIQLVNSNRDRYPVIGFELGNEPDLWGSALDNITPEQMIKDQVLLRSLIAPDQFIVGWDVASPILHDLFPRLLQAAAQLEPDLLRATTIHHYYPQPKNKNATAAIEWAVDPNLLDELARVLVNASGIVQESGFSQPMWIGETSSFSGGGVAGASDRFVAGFLWLDKLGLAARMGIPFVFRQTLRSNEDSSPTMSYGLLSSNILPNTDYWVSVLYKRLVGTRVLNTTLTSSTEFQVLDQPSSSSSTNDVDPSRYLRVYAHCAQNTTYFPSDSLPTPLTPGALTLFVLNLRTDGANINLNFSQSLTALLGQSRIEFRLTPTQLGSSWQETLASRHVNLNGHTLLTQCNGSLPHMPGLTVNNIQSSPIIQIAPLTYNYFVFPQASIPVCEQQYNRRGGASEDEIESIALF